MGSGKYLIRSINKYGKSCFVKEILQTFANSIELYQAERDYVTEEFVKRDDTFNIKVGGYGGGSPRTAETRAKMSHARKGRSHSKEHIRKIQESRKGIATNKGSKWSQESRNAASARQKGKPGRKKTQEEKDKIATTMVALSNKQVICPHCNKEGNVVNMRRWHFNNCKKLVKDGIF